MENNLKMINVIFMGNFSYPQGMAGTKRVQHFINHIKKKSSRVRVLLLRQGQKTISNDEGSGFHNGVHYKTIGADINLDVKLLYTLTLYFLQGFKCLYSWRAKNNILFVYSGVDIEKIFFIFFAKIIGYKIVVDVVEDYNYFDEKTHLLSQIKKTSNIFLEKYFNRYIDGLIVISNFLKNKFEEKAGFNKPLCLIPISAKLSLPLKTGGKKIGDADSIKIVYSGSFGQKDGLKYLIKAFKEFNAKQKKCVLLLTGGGYNTEQILLSFKNDPHIKYLGYLDDEDFYSFLQRADILCMPRVNTEFSNAGFPFKLGEYLATGKPVITTDIGDITFYLEHMKDAIIIEPENTLQLSQAMEYLTTKPDDALRIGAAGQKKCIKYFNPEKNSNLFFNFLKELV